MLRSKPKGSHNPSFDQDTFKHRHMECANNVRGGENCPSGSRNAEIQPRSTRALRNPMDPVRTTATNNRRDDAVLLTRGRGCSSLRGGCPSLRGGAFLLRKEAQRALIGWEARGPRCITASFKKKKGLK